MRSIKIITFRLIILFTLSPVAFSQEASNPGNEGEQNKYDFNLSDIEIDFNDELQLTAYALGVINIEDAGVAVMDHLMDTNAFVIGITDMLSGENQFTEEQITAAMDRFSRYREIILPYANDPISLMTLDPMPDNEKSFLSYTLGYMFFQNLAQSGILQQINMQILITGMADALNRKSRLSIEQIRDARGFLQAYISQVNLEREVQQSTEASQ